MTTQTPDAVREAVDPRVEIGAKALGLHRIPGGNGPPNSPTRWPTGPQDTLSGRDGTVPLTWDFAEQCRAEVRAILAALDSRAGDAGEVERLRKGLERARSDLHLVTLHGSVRPMWEEAKAARDRVHEVLAATPAPAVDAVPAGEVERLRAALRSVRDDLHNENGLNLHSIVDTIWHGPAETTVDFIDAALSCGEGRK